MIKWGGQLPIETPRLTLVPMQEEDGADLFAYYTEEIAVSYTHLTLPTT